MEDTTLNFERHKRVLFKFKPILKQYSKQQKNNYNYVCNNNYVPTCNFHKKIKTDIKTFNRVVRLRAQ